MLRFDLTVTPEIVFAPGSVSTLGEHAARFGRHALLVTGGGSLERTGVLARVLSMLGDHGVRATRVAVRSEPETAQVDLAAAQARDQGCDFVLGLGGGSALDTAKSVACLLANGGESLDYLEVVGHGRPIERPSVPFVAVPTTGGTGSETTRNAVLLHAASRTKASLRSPYLLPRLALVDPELSTSVPPAVTAATGLDAVTQLIEPYTSRRAQPVVDVLALDALRRAGRALPRAFERPDDLEARSEMMLASLVSGIALAHAGLGVAHALAGPLGGTFPVPHGFACAAVLPHGMRANVRRAEPGSETVRRYADVGRALGARSTADAEAAAEGVEIVSALCRQLAVPGLGTFGVAAEAFDDLAARARLTSSMKANPSDLTDDDLRGILEAAL